MGDSKSCIDVIFTDHPNLYIDCGVHPSLHSQFHHQIIHARLSVSNISLPTEYSAGFCIMIKQILLPLGNVLKFLNGMSTMA